MQIIAAAARATRRKFIIAIAATAFALSVPGVALAIGPAKATWTTLGTNSGPIPSPYRFEPANLLRVGDQSILVDAGDGASVQLARVGVPLTALHTVILSHLHFDHTGGLFAIISERYQMLAPGILTIYGPPGTKAIVDGLIAAMAPSPAAGPRAQASPAQSVKVVEVNDGTSFSVGEVKVTAATNSHYSATPGGSRFVSLSYRFDTPNRSIGYTGDTGPSANVERLEHGVDLLVSEVIDPEVSLAALERSRPDLSASVLATVRTHFEREHLTPENAGQLAVRAGAKELVLTHDAVAPNKAEILMRPGVEKEYHGPTRFARDLDTFLIPPTASKSRMLSVAPGKTNLRPAIVASTIGNALEWFDFVAYGLFAPIMIAAFFPDEKPALATILAFATFGIGFAVRPLGGLLLGLYADRLGRKRALSLMMVMMGLGSALIGIVPTYDQIGIAAPLLVVAARIIQGASVGGEFAAATTMLVEFAPPGRKHLIASFQMSSQALGTLTAGVVALALGTLLTPHQLEAWGWRVPFLLGSFIAPIGFYVRRQVTETPEFAQTACEPDAVRTKAPALAAASQFRAMLTAFAIIVPATAGFYVWLVYIPTFATTRLGIPFSSVMLASGISSAALAVTCVAGGWLADRIDWFKIVLFSLALLAGVSLIAFPILLSKPTFTVLAIAQLCTTIVLGFAAAPALGILPRLFSVTSRTTRLAIAQNLAVILFGGLAPLTVSWLVFVTGSKMAAAYYIATTTVVAALMLLWIRSKSRAAGDALLAAKRVS